MKPLVAAAVLVGAVLAAAVLAASAREARADEQADAKPPEPRLDRVDHAHPERYLSIEKTMGDAAKIAAIASTIEGTGAAEKIRGVARWIDAHLGTDPKVCYTWRTFDEILASKKYGGCADHSLVFGCLTRALGIPTVWVKTMDLEWIRAFQRSPDHPPEKWTGHVLLEVHVGGKWVLLDAVDLRLYEDYDPKARLIPGFGGVPAQRFAYDKGGDPFALVLSCRWELWLDQTKSYFRKLDPAELPLAGGVSLRQSAHVVSGRSLGERVTARLNELGVPVVSVFGRNFERWLREARGQWLIVTAVGDEDVLPKEYHETYLPANVDRSKPGAERRTLDDGTKVVYLHAPDEDSMGALVATLELEPAAKK